jgi:hypothetical protein
MESWIGFLGAVLGALVGSLGAGYWNLRLQQSQHAHALKVQQQQWDREDKVREDQRRFDRQEEQNREQRDIWRELQLVVPRFRHAAKWIYQRKLTMYREHKKTGSEESSEDKSQEAQDTVRQFNELRERLRVLQPQLLNEKARTAVAVIRTIGIDMVETNPMFWIESTSFYGAHDPQTLIYPRVQQLDDMLGRLFRGESIDDIVVVTDATQIPVERGS